jgi:membrane protease YdiL (CAAX protease family)
VRTLGADRAPVAAAGSLVRRRVVVVVTLIVGATLLHLAFAQPAGSTAFYGYTFALAVAGATGGLLSGRLPFAPLGRSRAELLREAAGAVALGVLIAGIFIAGASVVALIHPLRRFVVDVVTHTHGTSFALILVVTVINAVAEEVFFRGAVFAAVGPRHTVVLTTLIYIATIAISGNLALAFAAAVLGLVLALERRITGDLMAPALTHATWSAVMLIVLPLLF